MPLKKMKELDGALRKQFGIVVPELQQKDKFVTLEEFGIGIQNEITKASLSADEEKAKINKRAEAYIIRVAEIMKQAGEVAEGDTMEVPQVLIFEEAQVDKVLAPADGKPAEISLSSTDRDMFSQLLTKLADLGKAGHVEPEEKPKKKEEKTKKAEPYVWARDMAEQLRQEKIQKKDESKDKKPEKIEKTEKKEKKERSLKTEEEIQKAADQKKEEIQKAADKEKTDNKKKDEESKK